MRTLFCFIRVFAFFTASVQLIGNDHILGFGIFPGFNTTLRQGNVTHHEYIQVCPRSMISL
jgi:hypothetical protein